MQRDQPESREQLDLQEAQDRLVRLVLPALLEVPDPQERRALLDRLGPMVRRALRDPQEPPGRAT